MDVRAFRRKSLPPEQPKTCARNYRKTLTSASDGSATVTVTILMWPGCRRQTSEGGRLHILRLRNLISCVSQSTILQEETQHLQTSMNLKEVVSLRVPNSRRRPNICLLTHTEVKEHLKDINSGAWTRALLGRPQWLTSCIPKVYHRNLVHHQYLLYQYKPVINKQYCAAIILHDIVVSQIQWAVC